MLSATPITQIPGTRGVRIAGLSTGDALGYSVAAIGDINGDGQADIAIGAPGRDRSGATDVGAVYVVYGRATLTTIDLNQLNGGTGGFMITANSAISGARLGSAVSSAGDFNGDGRGDLLIGSDLNTFAGGSASAAFIVFGRASNTPFPAALDISALSGSVGVGLVAEGLNQDFGSDWALGGGGDVNADGFDDVIIGAARAGSGGRAYVIYGRATTATPIAVGALSASTGVRISAASGALGRAVALGGQMNSDTFADIGVGNPGPVGALGAAHIIFGGNNLGATIDVSTLNGGNGFTVTGGASAGEQIGVPLRFAGDPNGDTPQDVLIGALGSAAARRAYLVYGNFGGFSDIVPVNSLNQQTGLHMVASGEGAGFAADNLGDINDDNIDDFAVVADTAGGGAGRVYVLYGNTDLPAQLSLPAIDSDATLGEVFTGSSGAGAMRLSSAGKFDGDSRDDFLIAVPTNNEVYLVNRQGLSADRLFCNRFESTPGC